MQEEGGGPDHHPDEAYTWELHEFEISQEEEEEEDYALHDFWHALDQLSHEVMLHHAHFPFVSSPWSYMSNDERVFRVASTIQAVISEQMDQMEDDDPYLQGPAFVYPNLSSWENVRYDSMHGLVPIQGEPICTTTALRRKASANKYKHILLTLNKMWELCLSRSFATKRDLYYQNVNDYSSQSNVDVAVTVISSMLRIPRLQLRVLSTSKGLVAGSLSYVSAQGVFIDLAYSVNGDTVPQDVDGISEVKSDAAFILVVEKDATFQKLLDENFLHTFRPCIIVTGKGVPDLNTRQFVHHLWKHLGVPIFALVDADPFGVEIMCSYRFGSLAMAWTCERTAVPIMKWIGVHPSDFDYLEDESQLVQLSDVDRAKVRSLLARPYIEECPELRRQLMIMSERDLKAEIQVFPSASKFVREKICAEEWV